MQGMMHRALPDKGDGAPLKEWLRAANVVLSRAWIELIGQNGMGLFLRTSLNFFAMASSNSHAVLTMLAVIVVYSVQSVWCLLPAIKVSPLRSLTRSRKMAFTNAAIVHVDISNFDCKLDPCFAIRI